MATSPCAPIVLTYSAYSSAHGYLPSFIEFNPLTFTFKVQTDMNEDHGIYVLIYNAESADGSYIETSFALTIVPVNDAPVF